VRRQIPQREAALAAHIGMAAFTQAVVTWFAEPGSDLDEHVATALAAVRALAAAQP